MVQVGEVRVGVGRTARQNSARLEVESAKVFEWVLGGEGGRRREG